jgi:hypothetical protein
MIKTSDYLLGLVFLLALAAFASENIFAGDAKKYAPDWFSMRFGPERTITEVKVFIGRATHGFFINNKPKAVKVTTDKAILRKIEEQIHNAILRVPVNQVGGSTHVPEATIIITTSNNEKVHIYALKDSFMINVFSSNYNSEFFCPGLAKLLGEVASESDIQMDKEWLARIGGKEWIAKIQQEADDFRIK